MLLALREREVRRVTRDSLDRKDLLDSLDTLVHKVEPEAQVRWVEPASLEVRVRLE